MNKDRLLFGLSGIIIGLIFGVIIARQSPVKTTNNVPTVPEVTAKKQIDLKRSPGEIQKTPSETKVAKPAATPQQLPKGHPAIDLSSMQKQIADLEQKAKQDPKNQTALIALGNLNADSGNFPKAADWYLKAVENDPTNVAVISDLGTCYLQMQDFDRSFEYYRKALSIDPNHYQTLVNMGIYYLSTGEKNKAVEMLEKVIRLYPSDPRVEMFKKTVEDIRAGRR